MREGGTWSMGDMVPEFIKRHFFGIKGKSIEERFENAEEITNERLMVADYDPYSVADEISLRKGAHLSDVHLVGFNSKEQSVFYRIDGKVGKARYVKHPSEPREVHSDFA